MTTDAFRRDGGAMRGTMRTAIVAPLVVSLGVMTACVPPPPPKLPDAPQVPLQQRMAWILRLEDQRLLRFDLPAPAAASAARQREEAGSGRDAAAPVVVARSCGARSRRRPACAPSRGARHRAGQVEGRRPGARCRSPRHGSRRARDGRVRARAHRRSLGRVGARAASDRRISPRARARRRGARPHRCHRGRASHRPDGGGVREERRLSRPCSQTMRATPPRRKPRRSSSVCLRSSGSRRTTRWPRRCWTAASRSRSGGRSPTRCSASKIRAPRPSLLHLLGSKGRYTRAFAARGLGTAQGGQRGQAARRPSRSGGEGRAGADGRRDPRARPARRARGGGAHLASRQHAVGASEHSARSGERPSVRSGPPKGWRRCRTCGPTSGQRCALPRFAPPPPSTRKALSRCWRAWSPIATGAFAPRSPRRSARSPPSSRPTACARCCRTRTSA